MMDKELLEQIYGKGLFIWEGQNQVSLEIDFAGENPYEAAFEIAKEFGLKVEYTTFLQGMPQFKFQGTPSAIHKLAKWYHL